MVLVMARLMYSLLPSNAIVYCRHAGAVVRYRSGGSPSILFASRTMCSTDTYTCTQAHVDTHLIVNDHRIAPSSIAISVPSGWWWGVNRSARWLSYGTFEELCVKPAACSWLVEYLLRLVANRGKTERMMRLGKDGDAVLCSVPTAPTWAIE